MARPKVTVQEFGETLGISRQAAYRAIARCGIPLEDGLLDLAAGTALYRSRTRARVKTRPPARAKDEKVIWDESSPITRASVSAAGLGEAQSAAVVADGPQAYEVSRAQREAAEAAIAELNLGVMSGTLLERSAVERGAFAAARGLREALEGCAGQIAAAVAGLPPAEIERVVRSAHRQLLEDFVREIGRMIGPAAPALE